MFDELPRWPTLRCEEPRCVMSGYVFYVRLCAPSSDWAFM